MIWVSHDHGIVEERGWGRNLYKAEPVNVSDGRESITIRVG